MSLLDALRYSRSSYAVKLREFLRIVGRRPNAHVLFFEGQDSKYYTHRVELLRQELSWVGIDSCGKGNVLRLFHLISSHSQHKSAKVLYFIDRDFDEPNELPSDPRVYITPGYSIENLYVTETAFRRILRDEFGLSEHTENDNSFENCIAAFRHSLESFLDCSSQLNGWVILQRRHEKRNPGSTKANLNSISLNRVFQVGLQASVASYTLSEIERCTNATKMFSEAEANAAATSFQKEERIHRFRGKFQAHFYRVFLSKLCDDANSTTPTLFSKKRHVPLKVSEKNMLSELCQYADTPNCLREFIFNIQTNG